MSKYKLQTEFITNQKSDVIFSRSEKQIIIDTINKTIDFPYPDLHSLEQLDKLHIQTIKNQNKIDILKRTLSYSKHMIRSSRYYVIMESLEAKMDEIFRSYDHGSSYLESFHITFPNSNTKIQLKANAKALYFFFRRVGIRVLYPCQICKQHKSIDNIEFQICKSCEKSYLNEICKSFNCSVCRKPKINYCGHEGLAKRILRDLMEASF